MKYSPHSDSRRGSQPRKKTVALWLGCSLFFADLGLGAQEADWDPDAVRGECQFELPAWEDLDDFSEERYQNVTDRWIGQLRAAISAEYKNNRGIIPEKQLIDLSILRAKDGLPFVSACVGDSGSEGGTGRRPSENQNNTELVSQAWQAVRLALDNLEKSSARGTQLLSRLRWWIIFAILVGVATVVAVVLLLARLRARSGDAVASHDGFRSAKDPLSKLWNDQNGPMVLMREQIEALSRQQRTLEEVRGSLSEIASLLSQKNVPSTSPPPPRVDSPGPTPLQVAGASAAPGTGRVGELLRRYSGEARIFAWQGATRRFSAQAEGDFALVESQSLLIPRVARIQGISDWYRIPGGFELDNRETGLLVIEDQPVLERQSDGSFLLVQKGRLRTVSEK